MVQQRGGGGPFGGASRLSTEQLSRQGVSMSHITVPKGQLTLAQRSANLCPKVSEPVPKGQLTHAQRSVNPSPEVS